MHFGFINPDDIPPEVLNILRQQQDLHEMNHDDQSHQFLALIEELSEEQLITLRMLISLVGGHGSTIAWYFSGLITQRLRQISGVCLCGKKHDPSDLLDNEQKAGEPPRMPAEQEEYYEAKLKEYGVEDIGDPLGTGASRVRCLGCGDVFISLEDRMLRPVGVKGCAGCQHKAKFG